MMFNEKCESCRYYVYKRDGYECWRVANELHPDRCEYEFSKRYPLTLKEKDGSSFDITVPEWLFSWLPFPSKQGE